VRVALAPVLLIARVATSRVARVVASRRFPGERAARPAMREKPCPRRRRVVGRGLRGDDAARPSTRGRRRRRRDALRDAVVARPRATPRTPSFVVPDARRLDAGFFSPPRGGDCFFSRDGASPRGDVPSRARRRPRCRRRRARPRRPQRAFASRDDALGPPRRRERALPIARAFRVFSVVVRTDDGWTSNHLDAKKLSNLSTNPKP